MTIAATTATSGATSAPRTRVTMLHASRLLVVATGHRGAEVLRGDGLAGRTRRPAGRAGSPRSGRTARSARRGRPRSAAPPALRVRAFLMWPQIAAWAPTSTPRVGWAAISSTGSPLISRPTISFCWLPPDSARAWVSMPGRADVVLARRSGRCPCGRRRGRSGSPWRRAAGSGSRGSGSPTAARRAAGRAGAGPRGCSRCRPRGARGCPSW